MNSSPPRWSAEELAENAALSAALFRAERGSDSNAWAMQYKAARQKFDLLFDKLGDLHPDRISDEKLAGAYSAKLGEAIRYLAGPPISDDDLQTLADVETLAPGALRKNAEALRKMFGVIERAIDPFRFPWVTSGRTPSRQQREAALLASSVLLAAQRIATKRRSEGKAGQEASVKDYLRVQGFSEVNASTITTLVKGPRASQYCGECLLGERKADIVLRLHDTRLMAIECKVSNSAINSVKRINNDAAAKAEYWLAAFGTAQLVPAAMLSGVFKAINLEQVQRRGLALFWSHDLEKLGEFIESTR